MPLVRCHPVGLMISTPIILCRRWVGRRRPSLDQIRSDRHVERSEALRRARMERATCNGGVHRSEINESALVSESARAILRLSIKLTLSG